MNDFSVLIQLRNYRVINILLIFSNIIWGLEFFKECYYVIYVVCVRKNSVWNINEIIGKSLADVFFMRGLEILVKRVYLSEVFRGRLLNLLQF